jgi:hypothetical protein
MKFTTVRQKGRRSEGNRGRRRARRLEDPIRRRQTRAHHSQTARKWPNCVGLAPSRRETKRRMLGPEHPDTLTTIANLGLESARGAALLRVGEGVARSGQHRSTPTRSGASHHAGHHGTDPPAKAQLTKRAAAGASLLAVIVRHQVWDNQRYPRPTRSRAEMVRAVRVRICSAWIFGHAEVG